METKDFEWKISSSEDDKTVIQGIGNLNQDYRLEIVKDVHIIKNDILVISHTQLGNNLYRILEWAEEYILTKIELQKSNMDRFYKLFKEYSPKYSGWTDICYTFKGPFCISVCKYKKSSGISFYTEFRRSSEELPLTKYKEYKTFEDACINALNIVDTFYRELKDLLENE